MFTKRFLMLAGVLTLCGPAAMRPASAQITWQYRAFSGPASFTSYFPVAINNAGTIAGTYSSQSSAGAFIAQGGAFTTFGNGDTTQSGINNAGATTGYFYDANADVVTPYVRAADGTFTYLPKLTYGESPIGLNDAGKVVGYSTPDGFSVAHGAVWSGSVETTLDYPGSTDTAFYAINNAGKIVGNTNTIVGGSPITTAFVLENGILTPLSIPGVTGVVADQINNNDQILGTYRDGGNRPHGFILDHGALTTLDAFPNIDAFFAPVFTDSNGKVFNRTDTFTNPYGFNDREDYVGVFGASYQGADGTGFFQTSRGFVATAVPEPGSIALLIGVTLSGVMVVRRRRKVSTT